MADGDQSRDSMQVPHMSKAEMAKVVGCVGMMVYQTDTNKLAVKKTNAAATASWEIVTSVQDA